MLRSRRYVSGTGTVDAKSLWASKTLAGLGGFALEPALALVASRLGIELELRALAEAAPAGNRWAAPMRALLDGEDVAAAGAYREMELRPLEAHARLRAAEHLRAQGRHAEANEQLDRALTFWRSVSATRYLCKGQSLIETSAT